MAAPTLVDYQQSTFSDNVTTSEVTPTVTWQSGDLIVVIGITADQPRTLAVPTATGLTFAAITGGQVSVVNSCRIYSWEATAGSSGSGAITSTTDGNAAMRGLSAFVYRGHGGVGNKSVSAALETVSVRSLTRAGANSAMLFALADWVPTNDVAVTATPAGTERVAQFVTGQSTMFVFNYGDQGAAGTANVGITGFSGVTNNVMVALEIRGTVAVSRTSAGTGNWATGATWVGGVAPGDGETAIIADGHVVTIASGTTVTVGDPTAPTTPAIQSATAGGGTGCLIVDTSATLIVKGNVKQGNSAWQFNAGSTLSFEHATANLTWQISDGNSQANAKLVMTGTLGSRVVVQSTGAAKSGGFGWFGTAWLNSGRMECSFVNFTGIGTTTAPFVNIEFNASGVAFWDDCIFTSCGAIKANNNYITAGATVRIRRSSFWTPANASFRVIELLIGTGAQTKILFDTLRWEGTFYLACQAGVTGVTFTDLVGSSYGTTTGMPMDCSAPPPSSTVTDLFLYNKLPVSGNPSLIPNGVIRNLCSMRMWNANPHAMTIDVRATTVIDTGVWEFGESDENGDELQIVSNPPTPQTLRVTNIICPVCPDGQQAAGAFLNVSHTGSSANNRITQDHCTVAVSMVGATPAGAFTTENNTGGHALAQTINSNIWYRDNPGVGYGVFQVVGVLDPDTFHRVEYNAQTPNITNTDVYNPLDSTFGNPDVPGRNDIRDNPQFVDSTRRFLSWGQTIDPAANTIQKIVDEMMKRNDDSGYNPQFTIPNYIRYMRAGFTPRNPRFFTGGRDCTTIGAVPVKPDVPRPMATQQRMR